MADPAPDPSHLLAWLAATDAPCPVCGYNLRGIADPICPECAAPLHLQIDSANLDLAPWFIATIAFALAAGFDLVVSVVLVVGLLSNAPPAVLRDVPLVLAVFMSLGGASLTGLIANFRWRAAWTRMTRRRQWVLAMAVFGGVGAGHALVGWTLVGYFV